MKFNVKKKQFDHFERFVIWKYNHQRQRSAIKLNSKKYRQDPARFLILYLALNLK